MLLHMARATYVIRNGELVDKHLAAEGPQINGVPQSRCSAVSGALATRQATVALAGARQKVAVPSPGPEVVDRSING